MRPPLIGLTVHVQTARGNEQILLLGTGYVDAVRLAGGIPVLVPILPQDEGVHVLDRLEGLLVTAGGRLARRILTGGPLPSLEEINPQRYAFERALIGEAASRDLPMLGICRGMQMIAEVLGGRIANLAGTTRAPAVQHYQRQPGWRPTHGIEIEPGSRLADVLGGRSVRVNSFHRQAVQEAGDGLLVSARADDAVIEALESQAHRFLLAVQFHPERLLHRDERWLRLFKTFVDAARIRG